MNNKVIALAAGLTLWGGVFTAQAMAATGTSARPQFDMRDAMGVHPPPGRGPRCHGRAPPAGRVVMPWACTPRRPESVMPWACTPRRPGFAMPWACTPRSKEFV